LIEALCGENIEQLRPLLPVGYRTVAASYAKAAANISARDLSQHYTEGITEFRSQFIPWLKSQLNQLTGGCWDLGDFVAYAAGSDVDQMTHLVEAVAAREPVCLFPGDWYGFLVGSTHQQNIQWTTTAHGRLACLCIPSVRNGHVTDEMYSFLREADTCLLNLNLFPTLEAHERHAVASQLTSLLDKSILSISFSRGFGLTASQLGVFLVHKDHTYRQRFEEQWNWHTYFYNAIAAKTFQGTNLEDLRAVDNERRVWVNRWLEDHGLPVVQTGSYYVKSFTVNDELPPELQPLTRDGLVRLCFKPPQT